MNGITISFERVLASRDLEIGQAMEVIEDREHVEMYAFFEFGRMPWPLYRTLGI